MLAKYEGTVSFPQKLSALDPPAAAGKCPRIPVLVRHSFLYKPVQALCMPSSGLCTKLVPTCTRLVQGLCHAIGKPGTVLPSTFTQPGMATVALAMHARTVNGATGIRGSGMVEMVHYVPESSTSSFSYPSFTPLSFTSFTMVISFTSLSFTIVRLQAYVRSVVYHRLSFTSFTE